MSEWEGRVCVCVCVSVCVSPHKDRRATVTPTVTASLQHPTLFPETTNWKTDKLLIISILLYCRIFLGVIDRQSQGEPGHVDHGGAGD